ncbi:MAG: hypothetical protein ABJN75_07095 [Hoeflea sp.]|uniref:hypothetical protein n=1 Tax=Hoeflea sp. TaxID=1940281 RepID=UPI003297A0E7
MTAFSVFVSRLQLAGIAMSPMRIGNGQTTRTFPVIGVALLASLMLTLAGCDMLGFRSWSWHQKVTVTVATPNGEVSGASVMEVSWSGGIPFIVGDARGGGFKLTGEAPVVKLGNGRYLFALLKGMDSKLLYQLRDKDGRGASMKDNSRAILGLKEPLVLPVEAYPLLVTFADIDDPASVARVDPDDLAATFGPGYTLSSITLAITDEPVTKGRVEAVLGWLSEYPEPKLGPATGQTTNIPFNRRVAHGDFIRR